jgi:uncharacterized protein YndB with AHSA1/START domain
MAPEQFSMPERVDHRADIFSTGVVCYEMLTGQVPRKEFQLPSLSTAADPRFDPIVQRALEPDRERRYQQMREMNSDVMSLTRTPDSTLRLTQSVAAPIEKVFEAWIKPEVMVVWFAPTDEFTTPIAEVDLRVGGNYKVGMLKKDNPKPNVVSGQYCRIDPPNLVSFTWAWESHDLDTPMTQVTLEFRPDGPSTTDVTLTHERFRDEKIRDHHKEGWTGCLGRLASKLGS